MRKIPQSRPPGLRSWSTLHLKTVSDLAGIVLAMMKPILTNMKEAKPGLQSLKNGALLKSYPMDYHMLKVQFVISKPQ